MKKIIAVLLVCILAASAASCSLLTLIPGSTSDASEAAASEKTDVSEPAAETEPEPTELQEENTDFVSSKMLVTCNGVVYYTDSSGLWKKEPGAQPELLNECSANNLATNGHIVYYGVFHETKEYEINSYTSKVHQYDLYAYDLDQKTNTKITSFIESGSPICAEGDNIYYTDFGEDYKGNEGGRAYELWSYNMATGEKTHLSDGAQLTACTGGKIFFRTLMAAGGNFGVHQIHCYDIASGEITDISEDNVMSLKAIDGKLYYEIKDWSDQMSNEGWSVYCYDPATGDTKLLYEKKDSGASIVCYDEKYIIYKTTEVAYYRINVQTGEEEQLPASMFTGAIPVQMLHCGDKLVYQTNNQSAVVYTADDQTLELVASTETYTWNSMITLVGDSIFAIEEPYDNFYSYRIGCYTLK